MNTMEKRRYKFGHNVNIPITNEYQYHMHNEYELFYFLDGSAQYQIENTIYPLSRGDLLFIRPRVFHCLIPLKQIEHDRYVIQFKEQSIPDLLRPSICDLPVVCNIFNGSHVHRQFEYVGRMKERITRPEFELLLDHLLGEVLLELKYIPLTQHHHPVCGNEMLTDILRFIEQHPNVPMDISSISERYFVSRSWLEHTFRNQMGMSVTQYIRVKKILYAQALIQNGLPPTLAAQYCSYDNYSTFYRNYKKILLHSPEQDLPQ